MLPVAVDAMGGDNAPEDIIAGARLATETGISVVLVGRADALAHIDDIPIIEASEVIAMDAEASSSVRRMKDSSLVRAAEAVRDGRAGAMVGAGNTGATMASALLRMGRIKGVTRPAIATPLPVPGSDKPNVLLDAGANAEIRTSNATHAAPKSRLSLGLGTFTFPLFIALTLALGLTLRLGFVTKRRGRATALVFACILTAAWIVGCPGDDVIGPGPDSSSITFRVTLTGIGAEEAGTATDASVENLSLRGTNLTVAR